MTLKRKILVGYGIVFILMGLVIAWAVANLVDLGRATEAILSENYRSIIAAENMVDALERQDSAILVMLLGDVEKGMRQFRRHEAVFIEWMARAKDNVTIRGEEDLIAFIEAEYHSYRSEFHSLTGSQSDMATSALKHYNEKTNPVFSSVRNACIKLRNLNEETMYNASLKARGVASRAIWSTTLVAGSALIVALIFSLILAGRIVSPLRRFMDASRRISAGDYSVQVQVETADELGLLAREFNLMIHQLSRYNEMNIEQILAEKRKGEAILASIEDGLIVFGIGLDVTAINPAARRALKLESMDDVSWHCSDILPDARVADLIRQVVESGRVPDLPDEKRIMAVPGDRGSRNYLFSITTIHGKERDLTGIVLLLKDVTRLTEVERLKSEFVMAASHELRTPLTSLGMSVDLLHESLAERIADGERDLLLAAQEEIQRMKALINDLLDLSRIESGSIELDFQSVEVADLFNHVDKVFRNQAEIKKVSLSMTVPEPLPRVRADATKITWVLTNLISNALRYVSEGGHIDLAARVVGPNVHLSVQDDGPGIPHESQSKIFQKFFQVKGLLPGGTGLGLAICKEIVRAHGGAIWVESSKGKGSTFIFTLPKAFMEA